jgi:hypothetical protein
MIEQKENEAVFERNKEVEEWLMGSGESDATTGTSGSNNSNPKVSVLTGCIDQRKI